MYSRDQKKIPINGPLHGELVPVQLLFSPRSIPVQPPFKSRALSCFFINHLMPRFRGHSNEGIPAGVKSQGCLFGYGTRRNSTPKAIAIALRRSRSC